MNRYDGQVLGELEAIYKGAVSELQRAISGHAGDDGSLRLEVMQNLLNQAEIQLARLADQRNALLTTGLNTAAAIGTRPFSGDIARIGGELSALADDAVRFVRNFIAEDGLQLSDRIWRLDNHARNVVQDAIQQAIIQGHSASRAAADLLSRGESVGRDIEDKINAANADKLNKRINNELFSGTGTPYDNAKRLMRTEINRAHGEAYQAAAFAHEDVAGTRFLLSPNHPEQDICDMHARVNRFGLGPGVYPKGKNPWPAHPNTLSYVEVVFDDEISPSDKEGKQDRIAWLKDQPISIQESVLNSRKKRQALDRGLLNENEINTPWQVLKKRYEKRGHLPDQWD